MYSECFFLRDKLMTHMLSFDILAFFLPLTMPQISAALSSAQKLQLQAIARQLFGRRLFHIEISPTASYHFMHMGADHIERIIRCD